MIPHPAAASGEFDLFQPHSMMAGHQMTHDATEPTSTEMKRKRLDGRGLFITYFTAFWVGATVLSLEIVGSRILAPFFGTGLYVWSSLLAATMGGLGAGYHIGGKLADRSRGRSIIGILITGGLCLLLTTVLGSGVVSMAYEMGLKLGSLTAAVVLLMPPLTILGAVTPSVLACVHFDAARVGNDAGRLYATATLGSLAGGLATGFFLLEYMSTTLLLMLMGIVLIILGLAWTVVFRKFFRPLYFILSVLPAVLLVMMNLLIGPGRFYTIYDNKKVLWSSNSVIGRVEVADGNLRDSAGNLHRARFLMIDGRDQTIMELRNRSGNSTTGPDPGKSWNAFAYDFHMVRRLMPSAQKILVLGLGGGMLPLSLAQSGLEVDVVEIHPDVVRAACDHFLNLPPVRNSRCIKDGSVTRALISEGDNEACMKMIVADARPYVRTYSGRYDIIICNAIVKDAPPYYLYSAESLFEMKSILNRDGILALNLLSGCRGSEGRATASVKKTLDSLFHDVRVFSRYVNPESESATYGDVYFFASSKSMRFSSWPGHIADDTAFEAEITASNQILSHEIMLPDNGSLLLSDAHNPMDIWLADNSVRWFNALR